METFDRDGLTCQRWRRGASAFIACMERGARLMQWDIALPTGTRHILHWPDGADNNDFADIRGGNPILFPFAGRSYAGGERFFWNDLDGAKRPMPIHGLARQGRFAITASGEDFVEALFLPDADARESYPYACEFRVRYVFGELELRCELELTNLDMRDIPWSAGHHFYFTLPWHKGLARSSYTLDVPSKKIWRHGSDGKLVPFKEITLPAQFDNPACQNLICTRLKNNLVTFGPKSGEENIVIRIGDESPPDPWATIVTWAPSDDSPFFCVEPWMGPPNSPEHKNGLRMVAPGQAEIFTVTVGL